MAMRINQSKTFSTEVKFNLLNEDGKPEEQKFTATFPRYSADEVKELAESGKGDRDMCAEILKGWVMVDADTKANIEFNDEHLKNFLNIPGVAGFTVLRFFETVGAAKTKN